MENINLIRKIAWSFHHTTGVEWGDLFQEAALAYCEALERYDPERGKITTYMWWCITSHLKNYLKEQKKWNGNICSIEDVDVDRPVSPSNRFETLSKEALQIAEVIFSNPCKYSSIDPQSAKKEIAREMIEQKHWSWHRVWIGIQDLKLAFN